MIAQVPHRWAFGARIAAGFLLLVPGWIAIWTTTGYLNPIAFALLWTGAALLMWTAGRDYPGVRRHVALAAVSIPLWWYFEAVNGRTANWEYTGGDRYDDITFAVFASISFATVVPALVAATTMIGRLTHNPSGGHFDHHSVGAHGNTPAHLHPWKDQGTGRPASFPDSLRGLAAWLIGLGIASEVATLALPDVFYPLVWVAPFLLIDGLVLAAGGRSIVADITKGIWQRAAVIAGAGLLCGGLWEFWNFWAFPKWTYDVPLLDFIPVFEMPILGYGGYIPFAWSVLQLVVLVDLAANRLRARSAPTTTR